MNENVAERSKSFKMPLLPFEICQVDETRNVIFHRVNFWGLPDSNRLLFLLPYLLELLLHHLDLDDGLLDVPEGDLAAAGPLPGVDDVAPVLVRVVGQVAPPLHDEHARVADVPAPRALRHLEAGGEGALILAAVCESGAASRMYCVTLLMLTCNAACNIHLLDLALQMQQPSTDRNTLGLWYELIFISKHDNTLDMYFNLESLFHNIHLLSTAEHDNYI